MPASVLKCFPRENGEIQNAQIVTFDDWDELSFFTPDPSEKAFDQVVSLYQNYIVKRYGKVLGTCLLFRLPEEPLSIQINTDHRNMLSACSFLLKKGLRIRKGKIQFTDPNAEELFRFLNDQNCLETAAGRLPFVKPLPVADTLGFLSESRKDAAFRVNSSFFTMDPLDIATTYDAIGTSIGLMVKHGTILTPPLFEREVFLVKQDGTCAVEFIHLEDLELELNGKRFRHGTNCRIFMRPSYRRTPSGGKDLIITGTSVTAISGNGHTPVPASGFVLRTDEDVSVSVGDPLTFHGLEDIAFAVQGGNSAVIDGVPIEQFRSRFYNVFHPASIAYPPSFYPLNYRKDRAPRILLGESETHKPVIIWLEGAAKFGHQAGADSCGASLLESAHFADALGLRTAVHLDGGGSAEILLNGTRSLKISDRDPEDYHEIERAVAAGLIA